MALWSTPLLARIGAAMGPSARWDLRLGGTSARWDRSCSRDDESRTPSRSHIDGEVVRGVLCLDLDPMLASHDRDATEGSAAQPDTVHDDGFPAGRHHF